LAKPQANSAQIEGDVLAKPSGEALLRSSARQQGTSAQMQAQDKPAGGMCSRLNKHLLTKWATSNTVMLTLSDWSTTPYFFHHWLGNVKAAGINNWVAAAKDKATSHHYVDIGLYDRCFTYLSSQDATEKSAGAFGSPAHRLGLQQIGHAVSDG
jgi:hypothetical protein